MIDMSPPSRRRVPTWARPVAVAVLTTLLVVYTTMLLVGVLHSYYPAVPAMGFVPVLVCLLIYRGVMIRTPLPGK
jgi:cytochrome b561